jgi:hypothetical protein
MRQVLRPLLPPEPGDLPIHVRRSMTGKVPRISWTVWGRSSRFLARQRRRILVGNLLNRSRPASRYQATHSTAQMSAVASTVHGTSKRSGAMDNGDPVTSSECVTCRSSLATRSFTSPKSRTFTTSCRCGGRREVLAMITEGAVHARSSSAWAGFSGQQEAVDGSPGTDLGGRSAVREAFFHRPFRDSESPDSRESHILIKSIVAEL